MGIDMGIYYMEAWVLSRESAGLDGWTPLFATKRQSIDFEFLLQMELLLPEAALNM